ncbi:MAG: hypothetical protein KAW52_05830 [candidate division Zixibacteria bacterium]|nr:hypothetical protein [candidate division Zixibacteria bacterium]
MTVRCEVCCINIAQVKDYRHSGVGYDKYLVCPNCFMLDDRWFFKLKYAKEGIGKKKVMSRITDGTWKDYLTKE